MQEWLLIIMLLSCSAKNCTATTTAIQTMEFKSYETCMMARAEVLRKHDMITATCMKK